MVEKMSSKCPHCGKVPYPVYDNETKKVIWKNVFHIDWMTMLILATVLFSAWAYKHDTKECMEMLKSPCEHVDAQQCLDNIALQRGANNESEFAAYILNQETN